MLVSLEKCYGGPPVSTVRLSRAISDPSVSVDIWTTRGRTRGPAPWVDTGSLKTHCFPIAGARSWYYSPVLGRQLQGRIAEYDLVHIQEVWSYPQLVAGFAASKRDIPYVITPRGELDYRHLRHGGPLKRLKKQAYLEVVGNRILRNAACLHAISSSEAEELLQAKFCKSVAVIPNGVDVSEFENLPAPEAADERWPMLHNRRVVLFLSRLSPEKGLDQLITAWKATRSRSSFSDAVLVVAGPDSRGYEPTVRELIQEHGVADSVILAGMVSGSEKLALMNRADVYVLPSYSEGFSMSILENLAVGTPVLITPGCNFPEVVDAGAGVCVEPKAGEIAEGLRALLDLTNEERSVIGKNGRNLIAAKYTWDVQARKMLTVYRCILEGREIPLYPTPAKP